MAPAEALDEVEAGNPSPQRSPVNPGISKVGLAPNAWWLRKYKETYLMYVRVLLERCLER